MSCVLPSIGPNWTHGLAVFAYSFIHSTYYTYTSTDEPTWIESEKKAAVDSFYNYPENLIAIYVGNENLIPFGPFPVDDIINHIQGKHATHNQQTHDRHGKFRMTK